MPSATTAATARLWPASPLCVPYLADACAIDVHPQEGEAERVAARATQA